jgi:hypothetical protein
MTKRVKNPDLSNELLLWLYSVVPDEYDPFPFANRIPNFIHNIEIKPRYVRQNERRARDFIHDGINQAVASHVIGLPGL